MCSVPVSTRMQRWLDTPHRICPEQLWWAGGGFYRFALFQSDIRLLETILKNKREIEELGR